MGLYKPDGKTNFRIKKIMKIVIIQGSSRSIGNTKKIIDLFKNHIEFDIIDLASKKIGQFDYDFNNRNDDFKTLFEKIVNDYDVILFATPVYWYAMSGLMKTFFDRITDFLKNDKVNGRKLKGKYTGAISCGSDSKQWEGFFMPFQNSAAYLGMNYIGDVHTWMGDGQHDAKVVSLVSDFSDKIKEIGMSKIL